MSFAISRGRKPSARTTSLRKTQLQDVNNSTTEVRQILNKNPTSVIIVPSKEVVEKTEAGTRLGTSALDKSGSKEMGTDAPLERVLNQYTKQEEKPTTRPIISINNPNHVLGNSTQNNMDGTANKSNFNKGTNLNTLVQNKTLTKTQINKTQKNMKYQIQCNHVETHHYQHMK